MNIQPLTKKQFKAWHKEARLMLIDAAPVPFTRMIEAVQARIDSGEALPLGRFTEAGSHGFIDDATRKTYVDDINNLVYLVTEYIYGGKPAYNTVIYRLVTE